MPATTKCAYNGCDHISRTSPELSFHRFPNDENKVGPRRVPNSQRLLLVSTTYEVTDESEKSSLRKWILLIGRNEWLQFEPQKLKERRICSAHFNQTDFLNYDRKLGKRKLKANAVPTASKSSTDSVCDSLEQDSTMDTTVPPMTESTPAASVNNVSKTPALQKPTFNPAKPPPTSRRELLLMKKHARLTAHLKTARQTIRNLTRRTVKQLTIQEIITGAANYLDGNRLLLLKMQLRHIKNSSWSDDEKQFAVDLFYQSSKAYVFLRDKKEITLPCVSLVRRWANEMKLTNGGSTVAESGATCATGDSETVPLSEDLQTA